MLDLEDNGITEEGIGYVADMLKRNIYITEVVG